jgi:cell division protein FtsI/penicillin-binding protein 2
MATLQKTKLIEAFRLRLLVYIGIIGLAGFVIFIQLVNLQFVQGSDYQERAR